MCDEDEQKVNKLVNGYHPPYLWAFLTGVVVVVVVVVVVRPTEVFKVDILIIKVWKKP